MLLLAAMAAAPRAPARADETYERRMRGVAAQLMAPDDAPLPGFPPPLTSLDYEKLLDRFGIPFEKRPASLDAHFDRYVDEWRRLRDGDLASFDFPTSRSSFGAMMPLDQLAAGRSAAARLTASLQRLLAAMVEAAPDVESARVEERILRREFERSFIRGELGPRWLRGQLVDVQELVEALVEDRELRTNARTALESWQAGYDRTLNELREVRVRVEPEMKARPGPPPERDAPQEVHEQWMNAYFEAVAAGLAETFKRAAVLAALNLEALERLEGILPRATWLRIRARYFSEALVWNSVLSGNWDPFVHRRAAAERLEGEERARRLAVLDAFEPEWRRRESLLTKEFVTAIERVLNGQNRMNPRDFQKDNVILGEVNDRFIALVNETEEGLAAEIGDPPRRLQSMGPNAVYPRPLDHNAKSDGHRRMTRSGPSKRLAPIAPERLEAIVALTGGGDEARDLAEALVEESKRLIDEDEQAPRNVTRDANPPDLARRIEEQHARANALWEEVDRLETALFDALSASSEPQRRAKIERESQLRRLERLLAVRGSGRGDVPLYSYAWSDLHLLDLARVIAETPITEESRLRLEPSIAAYITEATATLERRRLELPPALVESSRLSQRSRNAGFETPEAMQMAREAQAAGARTMQIEHSLRPVNRRWVPPFLEAVAVTADRDALQMAFWHREWSGVFHNSTLALDMLARLRSRSDLTGDERTALARIDEVLRRQLMPIDRESAEILLEGVDPPERPVASHARDERHRRLDRLTWDRMELAASALRAIERTVPAKWLELRPDPRANFGGRFETTWER